MERSDLNKVETTQDLEKRIAFKAKLVSKIDSPQPEELLTTDNTFNGVAPGGKLVHPSLGEGILVEVDRKNNEVLIDFVHKGLIGLVLTQARSFVHAPHKEEAKIVDDPFIGEKIDRTLPDRSYVAQRDVDLSKVISPDFTVSEKTFFPIGSSVWHPDLGTCTVLSMDENTNRLTVSAADNTIDLILSQVRSVLRSIETPVEHVPMKPLVREQLAAQIPQYKSRGDVSVSLPEVFKAWQRNQQYMFLTRSQNLTTDQANDVFAVLDGNKPMFHSITVAWQSQEETQANVIPGPEALSTKINDARVFPGILQQKNLWHPDFGECSVASVEGNQLILMTSVGQVPCVLSATVPKLAVLTASGWAQHATPKQFKTTRVLAPSEGPVRERPKVAVTLPEAFVTWRQLEQYQFLTRQVASEHANDIIGAVAGTLHSSDTEYEIIWTDELPEANKRSEHKEQLLKRVEAASVEPVAPVVQKTIDPGIRRIVEEVSTVKKETVIKVTVPLPTDFNTWTSSGQYVYLTRTKHLTFSEANDVMDTLQGKTLKSTTQYSVVWEQSDPTAYATGSNVQRIVEENDVVEKESVLKKIAVTLPVSFKTCSESTQYSFLTRARKLTFSEANDAMNAINNKPFNSKIEYEIIWSD